MLDGQGSTGRAGPITAPSATKNGTALTTRAAMVGAGRPTVTTNSTNAPVATRRWVLAGTRAKIAIVAQVTPTAIATPTASHAISLTTRPRHRHRP